MKRVFIFIVLIVSSVPGAFAQSDKEHFQAGIFGDYFRMSQTNTNLAGVGARVSVMGYKRLKFEAEAAYDFKQIFTEGVSDSTGSLSVVNTNVRILHGLFGPRVNIGKHRIQPFVTVKGGGVVFRLDDAPVTFGTFGHNVNNLRTNEVSALFYPGGGVEAHIGPLGLRFDIGDEMYFNNGTHNNLRLSFGPVFRF